MSSRAPWAALWQRFVLRGIAKQFCSVKCWHRVCQYRTSGGECEVTIVRPARNSLAPPRKITNDRHMKKEIALLTTKICRLMTTTMVVAFNFSFSASLGAQGFPRGLRDALGSRFDSGSHQAIRREYRGVDSVRRWNAIAIDASGLDHTPVASGETRIFGEQLGPARSSRAVAMVHIAIFDAVIAITGGYQSYTGIAPAGKDTSMNAAIAQAAHDTLIQLFPSQAPDFSANLREDLKSLPDGRAKNNGIDLGRRAAAATLALRENDGSEHTEPRVGGTTLPAISRENGGRIQSARFRWPSARVG